LMSSRFTSHDGHAADDLFPAHWGTGPADKLAAGFRAALDQLGTPKTTAAKR
jgi:hypothetical protein